MMLSQTHWDLVALFLRVIAISAIFILNPFGVRDLSSEASSAMLNRWLSPLYPTSGQDHVAAVVLGDPDAEAIGGGYPMSLDAHGRIIKQILCRDPAAVFVDLNFRAERGGPGAARRFAQDLSFRFVNGSCQRLTKKKLMSGDVAPVFLAIVRNPELPCPSFLDADATTCPKLESLKQLTDVTFPIDVTDTYDRGTLKLLNRVGGSTEALGLSPPVALADALCRRGLVGSDACGMRASDLAAPMVLQWGFHLSPLSAERHRRQNDDIQCMLTPRRGDDLATQLARWSDVANVVFREITLGLNHDPNATIYAQNCMFTDSIAARQLIGSADEQRTSLAKTIIKDRAVIYGAQITALPDRIVSPVHGQLPGLFAHAMATDNLIVKGRHYWQAPPYIWGTFDSLDLIDFVLTVTLVIAPFFVQKNVEAGRWTADWKLVLSFHALTLALVVSSTAVLMLFLSIPSTNVILVCCAWLLLAGPQVHWGLVQRQPRQSTVG